MRLNNPLISFLVFFCFGNWLLAQEVSEDISLKKALNSIEKQHSVIFSYRSKDIEDRRIVFSPRDKSLKETLLFLEQKTRLSFTNLGNGYVTITLSPVKSETVTKLKEVYLFEYLAKGITQSKDGSFTIDYNTFDILPGLIAPDALKTAQALPGVESVDETVTNLSIRAGTHDQNLILWDGIKMYQSGHFFGLISAFNPNLTDKTTIYKNGTPAQYSDGVSGTFILETSDTLNDSLTGGIGINLINAEAFIDVPIGEKSSFQFSARSSINDVVETPTYDSYFDKAFEDTEITNTPDNITIENDRFNFQDASLRYLYNISTKDQVKVNALFVHNNLSFEESSVVEGNLESRESGTNQENLGGSFTYTRQWSNVFKTSLQLTGTSYRLEATNADIQNNQRLIQTNEVLEATGKLHSDLKLTEQLSLKNGYQFIETGVTNSQDVDNPLFQRTVKDVVRSHAIYSQLHYASKSNKSVVDVGGRLTYLDKFEEFILEPRIAISQKLSKHVTLNVLGELKHQVTSQVVEFQNDFLGVENRRWILADNDSIPVLKSKQVSAGLSYKYNGWLLSLDTYLKDVNGITAQSQSFQNQFRFEKATGEYSAFGIESLIYKNLRNFNIWFTYTYTNSDYKFEQLIPSVFPNNFELTHSLSFGSSYSTHNWKFATGFTYRSGKPNTLPNIEEPVRDGSIQFQTPNSYNLEDYFRLDLSATYTFKISKSIEGLAGASLWNVLSTDNTINQYFQVSDGGQLLDITQKSLGFTPNVSLQILF